MAYQPVDLDARELLTAVNTNLNRHFYAESRDHAKNLYQILVNGNNTPFMRIKMEGIGEIYFELSLDHNEYVGKLNFGRFRKNLALMMLGIKKRLDGEAEINQMQADNGELLFNIPGIVRSQSGDNILLCGVKQLGPGLAAIKLMYINPQAWADAVSTN